MTPAPPQLSQICVYFHFLSVLFLPSAQYVAVKGIRNGTIAEDHL